MKKLFLVILSIIFILPLIDYSEESIYFLWFLVIPLLFVVIKIVNKNKVDESVLNEQKKSFTLKDLFVAHLINFFFLMAGIIVTDIFTKIFPSLTSPHILSILFYAVVIQNVFVTCPGFYLCKIKISNNSFSEKLRLLIFNFYKYSFVYLYLLRTRVINQVFAGNDFPPYEFLIFMFYLISFCFRLYTKNYSLMERILRVEYYKAEVK